MSSYNINFKRLIRKYEYLCEEMTDIQELASAATREFNQILLGEDRDHYEPNINVEDDDEAPEKVEMDKKYKKLFRKIVVKCHPDKISKDITEKEALKLKELYETTVEAYDCGDAVPMIVCAVKLEIDVSEFEDDIETIEEACDNIQKYIDEIQSTSAWFYTYMCKTEKEKEEFIKKFLELTKNKKLGL